MSHLFHTQTSLKVGSRQEAMYAVEEEDVTSLGKNNPQIATV